VRRAHAFTMAGSRASHGVDAHHEIAARRGAFEVDARRRRRWGVQTMKPSRPRSRRKAKTDVDLTAPFEDHAAEIVTPFLPPGTGARSWPSAPVKGAPFALTRGREGAKLRPSVKESRRLLAADRVSNRLLP
jgi:hypothetical protein